jgi:G3E family GTPase
LVISKSDLAGADAVARLTERLRALNGRAAIVTAVAGDLDPRALTEAADDSGRAATHPGFVAEADHTDGIASFIWTETSPVEWTVFARALETLLALRGPDLLRVKGFLNVAGCRGPVLVQVVQHLAHPPVELAAWPGDDQTSRLVFITRDMGEAQVRALFAAVRALAPR